MFYNFWLGEVKKAGDFETALRDFKNELDREMPVNLTKEELVFIRKVLSSIDSVAVSSTRTHNKRIPQALERLKEYKALKTLADDIEKTKEKMKIKEQIGKNIVDVKSFKKALLKISKELKRQPLGRLKEIQLFYIKEVLKSAYSIDNLKPQMKERKNILKILKAFSEDKKLESLIGDVKKLGQALVLRKKGLKSLSFDTFGEAVAFLEETTKEGIYYLRDEKTVELLKNMWEARPELQDHIGQYLGRVMSACMEREKRDGKYFFGPGRGLMPRGPGSTVDTLSKIMQITASQPPETVKECLRKTECLSLSFSNDTLASLYHCQDPEKLKKKESFSFFKRGSPVQKNAFRGLKILIELFEKKRGGRVKELILFSDNLNFDEKTVPLPAKRTRRDPSLYFCSEFERDFYEYYEGYPVELRKSETFSFKALKLFVEAFPDLEHLTLGPRTKNKGCGSFFFTPNKRMLTALKGFKGVKTLDIGFYNVEEGYLVENLTGFKQLETLCLGERRRKDPKTGKVTWEIPVDALTRSLSNFRGLKTLDLRGMFSKGEKMYRDIATIYPEFFEKLGEHSDSVDACAEKVKKV